MTKILFICHGNICRSPMAEYLLKDLAARAGAADRFEIASAATSSEEIGKPVYPPAGRKLAEHGIRCGGKRARRLTAGDYGRFDLLIGMDRENLRDMRRICGADDAGKMHLLLDYTDRPGDVADPWYTGDFDAVWRDIAEGCSALLRSCGGPGDGPAEPPEHSGPRRPDGKKRPGLRPARGGACACPPEPGGVSGTCCRRDEPERASGGV